MADRVSATTGGGVLSTELAERMAEDLKRLQGTAGARRRFPELTFFASLWSMVVGSLGFTVTALWLIHVCSATGMLPTAGRWLLLGAWGVVGAGGWLVSEAHLRGQRRDCDKGLRALAHWMAGRTPEERAAIAAELNALDSAQREAVLHRLALFQMEAGRSLKEPVPVVASARGDEPAPVP